MKVLPWTFSLLAELFFLACYNCQNGSFTSCSRFELLGDNVLTRETRDHFGFTVYPSPAPIWGNGRNTGDEIHYLPLSHWERNGVQSKADSDGVAYFQINMKKPFHLKGFAVTGYSGGSYKPSGSFFLEGSNDECHWRMVAEGQEDQWRAPGTYPFHPSQIIKAIYPGRYQFYRVIAGKWTNGHMIIQNLGLFA